MAQGSASSEPSVSSATQPNAGDCEEGPGPHLVYALGVVGYDFGTAARQDGFKQAMGSGDPMQPAQLLDYLDQTPYAAADLIWTLKFDTTPVYAVRPKGPYCSVTLERLRTALRQQLKSEAQLVAVPGVVGGQIRLHSGQHVPVIRATPRGLVSWATASLLDTLLGKEAGTSNAASGARRAALMNFLERVYYELRNLGQKSQDRAINFAATNALLVDQVFAQAMQAQLELDQIGVEKSPVCRPHSDCWDVKLTFFSPSHRMEQARRVYRFTVDVSDVVPVTVGPVRSWAVF